MGRIRDPQPVVLFVAVSGIDRAALEWAQRAMIEKWGELYSSSEPFPFNWTRYYRREMGEQIVKQYLAFKRLIDPAQIVDVKRHANHLESEYAYERGTESIPRPANIDPGYVTEAKLVLATTKDRDHRIYLDRGVLAEVTLFYQGNRWNPSRWTYPDYNTQRCFEFLDQCRTYLRKQIRE